MPLKQVPPSEDTLPLRHLDALFALPICGSAESLACYNKGYDAWKHLQWVIDNWNSYPNNPSLSLFLSTCTLMQLEMLLPQEEHAARNCNIFRDTSGNPGQILAPQKLHVSAVSTQPQLLHAAPPFTVVQSFISLWRFAPCRL